MKAALPLWICALALLVSCAKRPRTHETLRTEQAGFVDHPQSATTPPQTPEAPAPIPMAWTYSEDPGNVISPGRGFYSWNAADTDKGLTLIRLVLARYCAADSLPTTVLDEVGQRLDGLSRQKQAIVRVIYADGGVLNACGLTEAARPELAIQHLKQLAPVIRAHRTQIAFFEAGFFGMWGEWNSEYAPNGRGYAEDPTLRFNMVRALLDELPEDLLIMLRRPRFREELATRMLAKDMQRLGFHNDCYLATATDMGTYDGDRSPEQWKDYIGQLTPKGQAIGGETCVDDPIYTNCEAALKDMQKLGMTYLNTGWNPAVLQRWKNEGCWATVEKRLGYRFVLTSADAAIQGNQLQVRMQIRNDGFAPAYQNFQPQIYLKDANGQLSELTLAASQDIDPKTWIAGSLTLATLTAVLPEKRSGSYQILVRWHYGDRILRFAVQDLWDESTQAYDLGALPTPQG